MAGSFLIKVGMTPTARAVNGKLASIKDEFGRIQQRMGMVQEMALEIAKNHAPVNTGAFEEGLHIVAHGEHGFAIIAQDAHVLEYLRGTGEFNPNGSTGPIVPRNSAVLVFSRDWRNAPVAPAYGSKWIFKHVAGQATNPWEREAYDEIVVRADYPLRQIVSDISKVFEAGFRRG